MYTDATNMLQDVDVLSSSVDTAGNSASILSVLAFEILLKCAFYVSTGDPYSNLGVSGHDYERIWENLRDADRKAIMAKAEERLPGVANLTETNAILKKLRNVFTKARYDYEFHWHDTDQERVEKGQAWVGRGAPLDEADWHYPVHETTSLIYGLKYFIAEHLHLDPPGS